VEDVWAGWVKDRVAGLLKAVVVRIDTEGELGVMSDVLDDNADEAAAMGLG